MKWLVQRRILCSFLSVFHTLIINPWLVIFKCVSSAKLSVLTSSSLAVLQILPVSHLFLPFIQSRGTATLLSCISPSLPLPLSISSPFSFYPVTLLCSLRTVHEGDWSCPFTCQGTSVLCKLVGTAGQVCVQWR